MATELAARFVNESWKRLRGRARNATRAFALVEVTRLVGAPALPVLPSEDSNRPISLRRNGRAGYS